MSDQPVIHWFRRDLRLTDNTALREALSTGRPVIPVYVIDPRLLATSTFNPSRMAFLLDNLRAVDHGLRQYGTRLVVLRDDPARALPAVASDFNAVAVYANVDYTPYSTARDQEVGAALGRTPLHLFDDLVLHPPGTVMTGTGKPYTVFTPFLRRWSELPKPEIQSGRIEGRRFAAVDTLPEGQIPSVSDLGLRQKLIAAPPAGETAARRRLEEFASEAIYLYRTGRNRLIPDPFTEPPPLGTSYLSPYLRLGVLSPRQAYAAALDARQAAMDDEARASVDTWIAELAWRDFYLHILFHFPHVLQQPFQPDYERIEFRHAPDELERWKAGQTGYPVVDAAMRQLSTLGWMHNRARMIVGSFLTKHLLIHYREGERHFMRHLFDGDPSANNGGWQWIAGSGTDAQPYYRIFNPTLQGAQYDPDGAYVRYWIPELRDVPDKFVHQPWEWAETPKSYPAPMVDHKVARERALAAFTVLKREKAS